jgi:threonine/homoserine/homoserine lactone efflux protein
MGAMLIEMLYLVVTILFIGFVLANKTLFQTLQWAAVVLLLSLAVGSFRSAYLKRSKPNKLTDNALPGFAYGLMMSAVNPLQFPFWAGWVIYFLSNGLPLDKWSQKSLFISGAGAGTFLALALFIFAGKLIAPFLQKRQRAVQFVFGCLFLTMAIFQVIIIL